MTVRVMVRVRVRVRFGVRVRSGSGLHHKVAICACAIWKSPSDILEIAQTDKSRATSSLMGSANNEINY